MTWHKHMPLVCPMHGRTTDKNLGANTAYADHCQVQALPGCASWFTQPCFAGRMVRIFIVAMMLLAQSGCSCSIFSKSTGCQARDAGLAAVLLPVIAVDRLRETLSDGHTQREQRRLVLAGDPAATILCMQSCADYSHLDDSKKLIRLSVQHIITWWDAKPTTDQLPALIDAHLMEGELVVDRDPVAAARHWHRGLELAADPGIAKARALNLKDGYQFIDRSDLDRWTVELETNLLVLRYQGHDGKPAEHSLLDTNCHPVSAWPPVWMNTLDSTSGLDKACSDAYIEAMEALPPAGKPVVNPQG